MDKDFADERDGEVEVYKHGQGDGGFEGEEEMPLDLEAGAVSWGVLVLGGLGVMATGVLL